MQGARDTGTVLYCRRPLTVYAVYESNAARKNVKMSTVDEDGKYAEAESWRIEIKSHLGFLPARRDASAGIRYATVFPSVCLSVCHTRFVSKRLNISSKFVYHLIAPSF